MNDYIVHPEDETQPPRLHGILGQTEEAAEQALKERAENNERYRISVDDETYKQFNKVIAYSDNPEDTAFKIGTAQKYAEMLDMSLVDAYTNLDTLNREYWGDHTTVKGAFKSVVDMLTVGKNSVKQGYLGQKILNAEKEGNQELVESLWKENEALAAETAAYADNGTPRSWITRALQAGAQSLPYTATNAGAALFGSFISGGVGGAAAGLATSSYLTQGQEYIEMRKKGIRPEIARNVSLVDGVVQGSIELCLDNALGIVVKGAGKGISNITQGAIDKMSNAIARKLHFGAGKKLATQWGMNYLFNVFSEGAEESTQQATGDVSQNIATIFENKKRAEELQSALDAMKGEYSEALEEELKKQYPALDEMTIGEIVKDSAAQFAGGAMGAITLGFFNTGVSSIVTGANVSAEKSAQGATFGEALNEGVKAGLKYPYATVEEYLHIKDLSEKCKSKEMFSKAVKDSAVFEGMGDEQKSKVINQIFEEGQARANEADEKIKADISESRNVGENAEASPEDETGERIGKAREYRTSTGELYVEEDSHRNSENDDDGKAHGRLLLGDPSRRHALEDDGNRYGYIGYSIDGDTVTIDDFKMTAGREGLAKEFYEQFAEKFADKNIEWNPKQETNLKLKQDIIAANPNGKAQGLNYFTADTIDDNKARIRIAKTIRENTKNWSDEQVAAGTALLTSAAKAQGLKLDDFVNNFFHNGQVITNKESDVENIAQAAAQHGATMSNVYGATQLDKAGKAIIYIGEHGDFNTFSHEVGHFFRKSVLTGDELLAAEKEFGVDPTTHQWTEAQEEAFADGFTDYLRTGKAKTKGLEKLFSKIAEFLSNVIRGLQGQIKLNDDLIKVYDSLLEDDGSGLLRASKALESAKAQEIAERKAAEQKAKKDAEQKKAQAEARKTTAERADENAERIIADESATTAEKAKATVESAIENAQAVMSAQEKAEAAKQQLEKVGLSKNKRSQIVYDNYNALTEEQKEAVKNELLSRDYTEIEDGIFAENGREKELGKEDFEKEFKDCQILRKIGAEKVYMLPQHYNARTDGTTGNCADTVCYFGGKADFIELKNLTKSNVSSLKWEYRKSLKQAQNVFIVYENAISNEDIKNAINGEICAKLRNDKNLDFNGTAYIYKSVNDEVVKIDVKKHALEMTSSAVGWANSESFNETTREPQNSFTEKILPHGNSAVNNNQAENADIFAKREPTAEEKAMQELADAGLLFQLVGEKGVENLMRHFDHVAGTSHDIKERTFVNSLKNSLFTSGVINSYGKLNKKSKFTEDGKINVNLFSFSRQGEALIKAATGGLAGLNEEARAKIFALGGIKRDEKGHYIYKMPLKKLLMDKDDTAGAGKYLFAAYPELENVNVRFNTLQKEELKASVHSGTVSWYNDATNTINLFQVKGTPFNAEFVKKQVSANIAALIEKIEADAGRQKTLQEYFAKSGELIRGLLAQNPNLDPYKIREQLKENAVYKETVKAAKNEYSAPILFQIIGEQGAARLDASEKEREGLSRIENLAIAKDMLKDGKDAKTIRLATGWEKGARKWRYEIGDDVTLFNTDYTPRRFTNDSEFERLNKKFNEAIEQGIFPPLPSTEQELFDAYNDAENEFIGKYIEYDSVGNASWKESVPLENVIKAPELFRAYPELKKVQFKIDPTLPFGTRGATIGDFDGNITISLANANIDKSTLLHELQHVIQSKEGFATGSNAKQFQTIDTRKQKIDELLSQAREIFDAQSEEWQDKVRAYNRASIAKDFDTTSAIFDELEDDEAFNDYIDLQNDALALKNAEAGSYLATKYPVITPQEQYRRTAGEVEARNVQSRMNMSAAERLATLLAETEDVRRADQIILDEASVSYCQSADNAEKAKNALDLSADFADVDAGKITEQDVENHINALIGQAIDTATEPLKIQITSGNKAHVIHSNLNLKGGQKKRHDSALYKIENIINNANKTGEEDVDLTHNTSKQTLKHKKNVLKYVAFSAPIKINGTTYNVALKAERVKGQNPDILNLYNVGVKKISGAAALSNPKGLSTLQTTANSHNSTTESGNVNSPLFQLTERENRPLELM